MKIVAAIVLLLATYKSSLSQIIRILDSSGAAVPYATMEAPQKGVAVFANEKGLVDLPAGLDDGDTVLISSIGFYTTVKSKKEMGRAVILRRQVVQLPEVFLHDGLWKHKNWGTPKKNYDGYGCSLTLDGPGEQLGRIIYPENGVKDWITIEKISFFYLNAGYSNAPVRLRICELDENEIPGNDLLTQTIVGKLAREYGWLDFDLSENPVKMPAKGVFVGVEYFSTEPQYWHQVNVVVLDDTATKKSAQPVNRLGGGFKTIGEAGGQGKTLIRRKGRWIRAIDLATPEKYKALFKCAGNLVVKVWVRYPGK